jgi:putative flippase GtrA
MIKQFIFNVLKLFYPIFKKVLSFEVYAYLAVGAANTLLNIGLFMLLYNTFTNVDSNIAKWSVECATIISFLISVFTGFWLSKNFAFTKASNEKKDVNKQFGKYFLVSAQGQFADYLITKGLIIFLLMHPNLAYFLSTVIMLILNFFLQKYFTFKTKSVK